MLGETFIVYEVAQAQWWILRIRPVLFIAIIFRFSAQGLFVHEWNMTFNPAVVQRIIHTRIQIPEQAPHMD